MNVAKLPPHVFSTTGMLCIRATVWHVESSLLFPALWYLHLGQNWSLNTLNYYWHAKFYHITLSNRV